MTNRENLEQNVAFIAAVKYRSRLLCRILKAAFPTSKFEIKWGPEANVSHGMSLPGAIPANATFRFAGLVVAIRHFNPTAQVRVTANPSIIMDPAKTIILDPVYPYIGESLAAYPAYTAAPVPPVVPPDDVPDPYVPPVYCWPCEDKIYTA